VEYGVASMGSRVYSGSPLVIECSEGVSTSSSPVDVPGTSVNLKVDGKSVRTFVLARRSCSNYAQC
jgi:hypothetical protein